MRALNDLKKLSAAFSIVLATMLVADDSNLSTEQNLSDVNSTVLFDDQQMSEEEQKQTGSLNEYLSELKRKQFGYEYEKTDQESTKLRDSWIRPIMISYSINRSNPYNEDGASDSENENAAIAIDQPIFQSGGIIYGVKFANASRDFANYSIDQQKRIMIKQTIDLLMQVKQSELTIGKQHLQISNSNINLEQQREQYLNGQLDSGFLNNAIIETNIVKQALFDLETRNAQLISQFKKLSDLDPKTAKIPFLAILDEQRFLEQNIDVKLAESESEKSRLYKNVTLVKYLPSVNLQASYNWQKQDSVFPAGGNLVSNTSETNYYRYGLKASMPLDINSYNDFEATKVEYLKSKVVIDDKKRELKLLYDQVMQNLINYDKKIALAEDNRKLYEALLDDTKGLYRAGYKTEYDVQLLSNSMQIEEINKKVYEIDKQLELLTLYEKMTSDVQ
ncbi:MAG: TolC family protein [Sulfurimonadaceae bacterium]